MNNQRKLTINNNNKVASVVPARVIDKMTNNATAHFERISSLATWMKNMGDMHEKVSDTLSTMISNLMRNITQPTKILALPHLDRVLHLISTWTPTDYQLIELFCWRDDNATDTISCEKLLRELICDPVNGGTWAARYDEFFDAVVTDSQSLAAEGRAIWQEDILQGFQAHIKHDSLRQSMARLTQLLVLKVMMQRLYMILATGSYHKSWRMDKCSFKADYYFQIARMRVRAAAKKPLSEDPEAVIIAHMSKRFWTRFVTVYDNLDGRIEFTLNRIREDMRYYKVCFLSKSWEEFSWFGGIQ